MAEKKCGAYSRSTGQPCTNPPVTGATRCRMHGGATPQSKQAAARRQVEAEARAQLARLDVGPVDNPLEALRQLAGEVTAWKDTMAERVNALTSIRYESAAGGEQLRAEVALWERALDRCATVLGAIARLNIDERLTAITEKQADAVVRAIDAALSAAGVSGEAAITARKAAARHLRAVP